MCEDVTGFTGGCAKCLRDLDQDSAVHLWDGKDYCRECVSTASPALAVLAKRFSILSERITVARRDAASETNCRFGV